MRRERIIVGVDENGFGPRLGNLTATAVSLAARDYDAAALAEIGRAHGIDDSKATTKFRAMKAAESIALALAAREVGGVPASADAFFEALAVGGSAGLREPCPSSAARKQCFDEKLPLPAFGGDADEGARALEEVERLGRIRVARVRTLVVCPAMLNREGAQGVKKTTVDLGLFERLIIDARGAAGRDVEAICGMVGGIRDVPAYARFIARDAFSPQAIERGVRAYRVRDVGSIRFETSADKTHMPVALASMVGKYARELGNHRMLSFYRSRDPRLPLASGYHDVVTGAFIEGATPIREGEGIPEECFLRSS